MYDGKLSYPLAWPNIYPRTPDEKREEGKFMVTFEVARDDMIRELKLLGGKEILISSNLALNSNGFILLGAKMPLNPGVAVHFNYEEADYCLCCDRWLKVEHNLRAIGLHIGAIRGMERWGVGSISQVLLGYKLP